VDIHVLLWLVRTEISWVFFIFFSRKIIMIATKLQSAWVILDRTVVAFVWDSNCKTVSSIPRLVRVSVTIPNRRCGGKKCKCMLMWTLLVTVQHRRICIVFASVSAWGTKIFLYLKTVGIRLADHATPLSAKVGTNFADKRRSLGRYSWRTKAPELKKKDIGFLVYKTISGSVGTCSRVLYLPTYVCVVMQRLFFSEPWTWWMLVHVTISQGFLLSCPYRGLIQKEK
jgi:hypothetical protein